MLFKVYCDESRISDTQYTLMGGIWIRNEYGWPFVNSYSKLCQSHPKGQAHHLKWTKTPPKVSAPEMKWYTDLIDLFVDYMKRDLMFFRAVVVDHTYNFQHPEFHQGDYEEGFYKLYYQLILHTLEPQHQYDVRIAARTVSRRSRPLCQGERLSELKAALNNGARKKCSYQFGQNVVRSVEAREESSRLLIQLADILMGAVGFHWTGGHEQPGARQGKVFLANYIASGIGRHSLRFTTGQSDRRFNIFRLVPR